jgi:HAD superfamily hydrolase (TIGR01484 family)
MKPKLILSDFDGTLTEHTELTSKFFEILDQLKTHNIPLVIVTGRSLSWAHFLLTHLSALDHVIAEGGGVLVSKDDMGFLHNHYFVEEMELDRLNHYSEKICKKYPGIRLSADSFGRSTDRALELFDLQKDPELFKRIKLDLDKDNINHSTSNVHLNFWCGEISKFNAVSKFMEKNYGDISLDETVYYGDSLNDQSMFQHLKYSVGVSNIKEVLKDMEYRPSIILEGDENKGPAGVLNHLSELLK